jgi:nucleoside-diphosphate-sugar epimerase
MARYTVTGGAGFIGSHLVEELLRRGRQVRVADNFSTGKRENVQAALAAAVADGATDAASRLEVLEGDLADLDVARNACAGADYVLHQAAIPRCHGR